MRIYTISLRRTIRNIKVITTVMSLVLLSAFITNLLQNNYRNSDNFAITNANVGRVIIIDAGQGGEDPGAIGVDGSYEKDLNLTVATTIGEILTEKGYTVIYTRTEDKMLYSESENIKGMRKLSDLKNRVKIAEEYPGATLISIHMNSFGAAQYSGLQVYYQASKDNSRTLADAIQNKVRSTLQPENDRKVKSGEGIYLLENSSLNTVLVECGFLTNPTEAEKLCEKEYQNQLSFAIVCGIIEYIETKTP